MTNSKSQRFGEKSVEGNTDNFVHFNMKDFTLTQFFRPSGMCFIFFTQTVSFNFFPPKIFTFYCILPCFATQALNLRGLCTYLHLQNQQRITRRIQVWKQLGGGSTVSSVILNVEQQSLFLLVNSAYCVHNLKS